MKTVLLLLWIGFAFTLVAALLADARFRWLQRKGDYPKKGDEREADVLRLLKGGEFALAVRCYRAVHKVHPKVAIREVLRLWREMKKGLTRR
jgi:hypothetical protein